MVVFKELPPNNEKAHNLKYYELIINKEKHTSMIGVRVLTPMVPVTGLEPALYC